MPAWHRAGLLPQDEIKIVARLSGVENRLSEPVIFD
jgi:hypothetical protein